MKREPLTRSAPAISALTKTIASSGTMEPSASSMTIMSPVTARNPACSAAPLPRRGFITTFTSSRRRRATETVSSVERPSTMTTSCAHFGMRGRSQGRFLASLSVGTTKLTRGRASDRPSATPIGSGASTTPTWPRMLGTGAFMAAPGGRAVGPGARVGRALGLPTGVGRGAGLGDRCRTRTGTPDRSCSRRRDR